MTRTLACLFALLALAPVPAVAGDCGGEAPCVVEDGSYRIELPADRPATGVVLFFHGYRGSAAAQMQARGLIETAHRHGLAFAAPDGRDGSWSHVGSPSQVRDERRFVGAVLDDLSARFGFGPDKVVVSGFSQGASMAFSVACDQGDRVAAAVTFAGVFWQPLPDPERCKAPPPMVHVHGLNDPVFPLEGRPIGERWHQGRTSDSLAVMKEAGGCEAQAPTPATIAGLGCEVSSGCDRGPIALCLHTGGHEVRPEWLDAALGRLGF